MSKRIFDKVIKDKEKDEKFLKLIRKFILAYFLNTFSDLFLVFFGGTMVYFLFVWLVYGDFKFHFIEFIGLVIYWFLVLFIWVYFWYNTYLLITTHRIEKHKPTYLFGDYKEILWYKEVNKISFSYPSIIAKIIDYGNIEIMAGETEKNNIIFEQVPHPEKITIYLRGLKKKALS